MSSFRGTCPFRSRHPNDDPSKGQFKKFWREILKCVVHPDYMNKGVDVKLIKSLIDDLRRGRCESIYIRVNERDLQLQLSLKGLKFKAIKVIRGYYGEDDAYLMKYELPEDSENKSLEL